MPCSSSKPSRTLSARKLWTPRMERCCKKFAKTKPQISSRCTTKVTRGGCGTSFSFRTSHFPFQPSKNASRRDPLAVHPTGLAATSYSREFRPMPGFPSSRMANLQTLDWRENNSPRFARSQNSAPKCAAGPSTFSTSSAHCTNKPHSLRRLHPRTASRFASSREPPRPRQNPPATPSPPRPRPPLLPLPRSI